MTATLTNSRHKWTKEELSHLNRSVSHAKNKRDAFSKIAEEMGLDIGKVSATYYAHKRTKKTLSEAVPAPKVSSKPRSITADSAQPMNPMDFSKFSERELHDISQAITFEVARRIEQLRELESMFKS